MWTSLKPKVEHNLPPDERVDNSVQKKQADESGLPIKELSNQPKPPNVNRPDVSKFLIRELNLNKKQQQQYELLIFEHRSAVEKIKESDHKFHKLFFDFLYSNNPDINKTKQIADSIGNNKKKTEMLTFNHFLKLKALCNQQQKEKFDQVIMEALRIMNPRPAK